MPCSDASLSRFPKESRIERRRAALGSAPPPLKETALEADTIRDTGNLPGKAVRGPCREIIDTSLQ